MVYKQIIFRDFPKPNKNFSQEGQTGVVRGVGRETWHIGGHNCALVKGIVLHMYET